MRNTVLLIVSVLFIAGVSVIDSKIIQELEFFESLDTLESNDQEIVTTITKFQDEESKLVDSFEESPKAAKEVQNEE